MHHKKEMTSVFRIIVRLLRMIGNMHKGHPVHTSKSEVSRKYIFRKKKLCVSNEC